mmetsp:Transcript_5916/g.13192  ORF Transcript_5916/g.13192 Transcript_5916/m.13192 type:complete len:337 (-) Transcript_5916:393-1403(-)
MAMMDSKAGTPAAHAPRLPLSLSSFAASVHQQVDAMVDLVKRGYSQAKATTSDIAEGVVVTSMAYVDYAKVIYRERVKAVETMVGHAIGRVRDVIAPVQSMLSSTWTSANKVCNDVRVRGPRACIVDAAATSREVAVATAESCKLKVIEKSKVARKTASDAIQNIEAHGRDAATYTAAKAAKLAESSRAVASDGKFQATVAVGAGGAATCGAVGGAAGLLAGGASGAALGVIPALFTFGLSIPVGAALGAGAGLVAGTAAGGTVGAVAGGAIGYSKEKDIRSGATKVWTAVNDGAEFAQEKTSASADYVKGQVSAVKGKVSVVKARLVRGGTGGTA